jgi:hypothetical protein
MPAKTQAEIDLEIMQSKYGKNELLHQALDRAVLGGRMRVEAVKDALDLYGDRCLVDEKNLDVTLNGLPLDEAVAKLVEDRPLWAPSGPDPKVEARKQLEADAIAGSVKAHGALYMSLGSSKAERDANYAAWKLKHGAAPGRPATVANDTNADVDPKNPFSGFRDASGKVDPVKAAVVAALIKSAGIAHVTALAKQAGVTLGGYPLVRKAG